MVAKMVGIITNKGTKQYKTEVDLIIRSKKNFQILYIRTSKSCEQEGNISITSGNTQSLTSQTVADDTPFLLDTDSDDSGRE
jgi:hypothetical protein